MAITHRAYVIITFPLCCVSIALLATSLSTQNWLESKGKYENPDLPPIKFNYGLFTGTLTRSYQLEDKDYELHMTCLADLGICALSCLNTQELREIEVRDLYNAGGNVETLVDCEAISRASAAAGRVGPMPLVLAGAKATGPDPSFVNMGVWGSTITFIALALLMATMGAVFAVINAANTPVEPIFGILGLFIWNACAAFSIGLALIIWGCHFGVDLTSNAAIAESITGTLSTNGLASIGYSFWILIGADIMHLVNIGLLLVRRHMVLYAPPPPTIELKEDNDGAIFLY
ncbi:uncharacterized protein LOC135946993 [Cloeon dipterum]|uniref:uncharacterized protein LOC135946993 n=1 Tax=Cloeon dipterum TaxID=197152 RepID=UPI0032200194